MRPQQDRLVDEFLFILLIVVDVHSLTTFQSRLNSNNAGGGGGGGGIIGLWHTLVIKDLAE